MRGAVGWRLQAEAVALFQRRSIREEPNLSIRVGGLLLRPPLMEDFEAWARVRMESRLFLEPWEPIWPTDDLTRTAFRRRLRRYDEEILRDEAYPFLIFLGSNPAPVGGLTLGNVRRGVAQTAALGYWMAQRQAGRGIMTAAVLEACKHAYEKLLLRRIEAACLPENKASIRLLEKAGFKPEGQAREYLCIAGRWRDHLLFAKLRHDQAPIADGGANRNSVNTEA